jgi:hypothetical protein
MNKIFQRFFLLSGAQNMQGLPLHSLKLPKSNEVAGTFFFLLSGSIITQPDVRGGLGGLYLCVRSPVKNDEDQKGEGRRGFPLYVLWGTV